MARLRALSCGAVLLALCSTACGSSDTGNDDPPNSGPPATRPEHVGTILDAETTCTDPNTICIKLQVPDGLDEQAEHLMIDIYDSTEPPSHPPNGYAGVFPSPDLVAGQMLQLQLSDGQLTGDYWLWAIMYMPGGGAGGVPVSGVDYIMISAPTPVKLDGTPLNISEPVRIKRI